MRALPEKDKKGYINQLGLQARCVVVLLIIVNSVINEYEMMMIFFNYNASRDVIIDKIYASYILNLNRFLSCLNIKY